MLRAGCTTDPLGAGVPVPTLQPQKDALEMALFFISHDQGYDSSSSGGEWRNPDPPTMQGANTSGQLGHPHGPISPPKPRASPSSGVVRRSHVAPSSRGELPYAPRPSQKEGEAGSNSPLEKPPLHSHRPIPKAFKASGIRDSEEAVPVQEAGSSPRLQSPKGQTRIAAAP